MDADGGNAAQFTSLGTYAGSPKWSQDGLRIAFDGVNAGNRDIYVVSAEGGAPLYMCSRSCAIASERSERHFSRTRSGQMLEAMCAQS